MKFLNDTQRADTPAQVNPSAASATHVSRRNFLAGIGLAAAGIGLGASVSACSTSSKPNEALVSVLSQLEQLSEGFSVADQPQMKSLALSQAQITSERIFALCTDQGCTQEDIEQDVTDYSEDHQLFAARGEVSALEALDKTSELQEFMINLSDEGSAKGQMNYITSLFAALSVGTQNPSTLSDYVDDSDPSIDNKDSALNLLGALHTAIYASGIALSKATGQSNTAISKAAASYRSLRDQLSGFLAHSGVSDDQLIAPAAYTLDDISSNPSNNEQAVDFMLTCARNVTYAATSGAPQNLSASDRKVFMTVSALSAQAEGSIESSVDQVPLSVVQRGINP